MDNYSELKKMLGQIDIARNAILERLNKEVKSNNPYFSLPLTSMPTTKLWTEQSDDNYWEYCEHNKSYLQYDKVYHLVTLTFSPKISKNLSEDEQVDSLTFCINQYKNLSRFACLEKHQSGILHAHILVIVDPVNIQSICDKYRSRLISSRKNMPAIKVQLIKPNLSDILRTYHYIVDHKKDHPKYKLLIFFP